MPSTFDLCPRHLNRAISMFLALLVGVTTSPHVWAVSPVELVILHVNDLHGHAVPREFLGEQLPPEFLGQEVGSLFSAATIVEQTRSRLFATDPALEGHFKATGDDGILFLDGGDTYSGTLDDFETEGGNAIEIENSPYLDVDAAVVGNHSWDFGPRRWEALARTVVRHHPLLAANLQAKDGQRLPWVKDYVIQDVRGIRIAVIGLIAEGALHSAAHENVTEYAVLDPMARLRTTLDEVRDLPLGQRPDLVIVLAHVAFERGRPPLFQALAALDDQTSGDDLDGRHNVDLVIDAHSHVDHTVAVDSNTWLVQADHYGVKLGEVVLRFDPVERRLVEAPKIRRIPLTTATVPLHAGMMLEHSGRVAAARASNDRPVVPARADLRIPTLPRTAVKELSNPSGNLFTRAMLEIGRKRFGAVAVALVNQTGVRAGLYASKAGALTAGSLHALSPFANRLSIVKIQAAKLRKVLEKGLQHVSKLSWAGLEVVAHQKSTAPGSELFRTLTSATLRRVDGPPVALDDLGDEAVTVIAPSFVVGRELKAVVIPGSQVDLDLTDREAVLGFLQQLHGAHGPLTNEIVRQAVGQPARLVIGK